MVGRMRCRNDAQQWTTVQRAARRNRRRVGEYLAFVPSMKESKRNNYTSGPGGHCSTTHDRSNVFTPETATEPAIPHVRSDLVFARNPHTYIHTHICMLDPWTPLVPSCSCEGLLYHTDLPAHTRDFARARTVRTLPSPI
ncbi:hypothetical protein ACS0PU_004866 [Formica fusca]